tara:strand:+ start:27 stop:1421 length:1395 start_codon:yes stop_codon:yes gene_type:complete
MAKKNKLKEAPIDYSDSRNLRISPDIEARLKSQDHPLGGHKAFPDIDQDGKADNFEELIATKRFQDVIEKIKSATGLEIVDQQSMMQIQGQMMQAVQRMMQIESNYIPELQELAVKLVKDQMSIPEGDLQFDAKIEKPNFSGMDMKPKEKKKETPKQKQPQIDDGGVQARMDKLDLEKQKRRFVNSLISGSSKKAHYMYHMVAEELNAINEDLVGLYSLVMSVNDIMYWVMPDMDSMSADGAEQSMAGKEELDLTTDPPTIKATGMFFPVLVHELWKGVMEYMSAHGLPSDPEFAAEVMDDTDNIASEIWDLRLGPVIWEKFTESYPESLLDNEDMGRIKNYLYFNIISIDAEPFLALAKEILSGSQKGKDQVEKIVNDIVQQLKDEDYEDVSGETQSDTPQYEIPGFEGTMDMLDDALNIRPKDVPKTVETPKVYDMDTLLDKIGKSGMDSLTKDEKDFLYNM